MNINRTLDGDNKILRQHLLNMAEDEIKGTHPDKQRRLETIRAQRRKLETAEEMLRQGIIVEVVQAQVEIRQMIHDLEIQAIEEEERDTIPAEVIDMPKSERRPITKPPHENL